jgi:hypothetical protein
MDPKSETHALTIASCNQKTTDAQLSNQSQCFRTESLPTKFGYQKIPTEDWRRKKPHAVKLRSIPVTETYQSLLSYGSCVGFSAARRYSTETTVVGWGAWIRTREWRNQNPLPYHLATPQFTVGLPPGWPARGAEHSGENATDQCALVQPSIGQGSIGKGYEGYGRNQPFRAP